MVGGRGPEKYCHCGNASELSVKVPVVWIKFPIQLGLLTSSSVRKL
jgi:hypothetical protein